MKRLICFVFAVLFAASAMPVSAQNLVKVYGGSNNDEMKIALTFDDGPHPKYTEKILDILAQYEIKATFFVVGQNVEYYSETAKRAVREGHEIGNHTYSHPHIRGLDSSSVAAEVRHCEETVERVLGCKTTLFRPPEGVIDDAVKSMAGESEYDLILWRIDTRDWAGTSTRDICANISNNIRAGDIILMHDYITKSCHTVDALEQIIPTLLERGYKFVTVSELIKGSG